MSRRSFWWRPALLLVRWWTETDDWRESDLRRYCLAVLWLQFKFERQTKPDARWHFSVALRSHDGTGWDHHGGWATGKSNRYCTIARLDFYASFSMRPVYKIVYAPSWIRSVARLTGRHPIEIAEKYVAEGREITPLKTAPAEDGGSNRSEMETSAT